MAFIKSFLLFILAGLCKIGGGYLMWRWLNNDKPVWWGIIGGIVLILYGVTATWQTTDFGRVNTAYGGIFIIMVLISARKADNFSRTNGM